MTGPPVLAIRTNTGRKVNFWLSFFVLWTDRPSFDGLVQGQLGHYWRPYNFDLKLFNGVFSFAYHRGLFVQAHHKIQ